MRYLWLVLAVLLIACERQPQLPHLAPDAVILAFGDSITYGTGANPGESYPDRLESLVNRRVISSGVPGETSAEGLQRLPQVLDETHPNLLILCLGGNDFLQRQDMQQTLANLRQMAMLAKQRGIAVTLVGVPRFGWGLSTAPIYGELAKELKLPLEDKALADILSDSALKSDYVHPNAKGYDDLAKAIAKVLQQSGAI